ncbi:MAG: hypothetical protein D8M59_12370 [Planctomycetes bacterium]|nr:hypothetical protein [Planctomycetota bacterium]
MLLFVKYEGGVTDGEPTGAMIPLGQRSDVYQALAEYNTSPEVDNGEVMFGPGLTIQMPMTGPEVTQLLVSIGDEGMGWPVVERIARGCDWTLMDPDSGRVFSFS